MYNEVKCHGLHTVFYNHEGKSFNWSNLNFMQRIMQYFSMQLISANCWYSKGTCLNMSVVLLFSVHCVKFCISIVSWQLWILLFFKKRKSVHLCVYALSVCVCVCVCVWNNNVNLHKKFWKCWQHFHPFILQRVFYFMANEHGYCSVNIHTSPCCPVILWKDVLSYVLLQLFLQLSFRYVYFCSPSLTVKLKSIHQILTLPITCSETCTFLTIK
jgi:hypothetical protein